MKLKRIICFLFLLLVATTAFSQVKADPASPEILTPAKEQLLAESKSQKKIGKILLWGGIGLVIAGAATYDFYFTPLGTPSQPEEVDNTLSGVLAVAGLFSIVGGAVQLAAAKSSKGKALSLVIYQERVPIKHQGAFTLKAAPAVGVQIAF